MIPLVIGIYTAATDGISVKEKWLIKVWWQHSWQQDFRHWINCVIKTILRCLGLYYKTIEHIESRRNKCGIRKFIEPFTSKGLIRFCYSEFVVAICKLPTEKKTTTTTRFLQKTSQWFLVTEQNNENHRLNEHISSYTFLKCLTSNGTPKMLERKSVQKTTHVHFNKSFFFHILMFGKKLNYWLSWGHYSLFAV